MSAFIPQNGESANSLSMMDTQSLFGKYVTPTATTLVYNPAGNQPAFCNDCSAGDVAMRPAKLRPEPLVPFATPVTLTAANYGSVAKYDILTRQDHAVSYPFQKTLQARLKFVKSVELDSSHVSFFSQPDALTMALEGLCAC